MEISEKTAKQLWRWWLLFLAFALLVIAGVKLLTSHPTIDLKTHLDLLLATPRLPNDALKLSDIPIASMGNFSVLSKASPIVEIPVGNNESNVELQFEIAVKDSSPFEIRDMEAYCVLPQYCRCKMSSGWFAKDQPPCTLMPDLKLNTDFKGWITRSSVPLFAGKTQQLPIISFSAFQPRTKTYGNLIPMFLSVTTEYANRDTVAFWLLISREPAALTNEFHPRIVLRQQIANAPDGTLQLPAWTN